jgi:YD repeat-containing protein
MRRALVIALAACGSAPAPVANRSTPGMQVAPVSACPQFSISDGKVWKHVAFPQCPPVPFEIDFGCGDRCPRPCRYTETYEDSSEAYWVSWDARGRWVGTRPVDTVDLTKFSTIPTYDGERLTEVLISNGYGEGATYLKYDARGRLVGVDDVVHLEYGADGRIARYIGGNEIVDLAYDAAGRLVRQSDATRGIVHAYHYDAEGYLIRDDEAGGATEQFEYDAQHRRVRAIERWPPASPGLLLAEERFRYDARGRLVEVISRSATADRVDPDLSVRYDYDCER